MTDKAKWFEKLSNEHARSLEAKDKRIAELEGEHGDMNVHCVKLEKKNERLRAALEKIRDNELCGDIEHIIAREALEASDDA